MCDSYDDRWNDHFGCGDARRCPVHPNEKISSDNGLFDAPCGICEADMADQDSQIAYDEFIAKGGTPPLHKPFVTPSIGNDSGDINDPEYVPF